MNNTFETPRLLLKPRTMDDLENCIKMDVHPLVTHYIPGIWDGSTKHITFLKEKILFPYPTGLGYWSILDKKTIFSIRVNKQQRISSAIPVRS